MAPAGLRVTQYSLLNTLSAHGPMRISDLAKRQLLDRTALSRNLDPLVERRLVKVVPGSDARTRQVELTRAGRAALASATPYWREAQAQVAKRLGRTKLEGLVAVLGELEGLHPDSLAR